MYILLDVKVLAIDRSAKEIQAVLQLIEKWVKKNKIDLAVENALR